MSSTTPATKLRTAMPLGVTFSAVVTRFAEGGADLAVRCTGKSGATVGRRWPFEAGESDLLADRIAVLLSIGATVTETAEATR